MSDDQHPPAGQQIAFWFRNNRHSNGVSDIFFKLADRGMPLGTDEQILSWLEKGDESGDFEATTVLANIYATGIVRPGHIDRAAALYRKPRTEGSPAPSTGSGYATRWARVCRAPRERPRPGTERRRTEATCLHSRSWETCTDSATAFLSQREGHAFYKMAADRGYVPACCILARMYEQGDGVPRSKEQAIEWYQKAADNADNETTRELN